MKVVDEDEDVDKDVDMDVDMDMDMVATGHPSRLSQHD